MTIRLLDHHLKQTLCCLLFLGLMATTVSPALAGLAKTSNLNLQQISFIPNQGQMEKEVLYYHQGNKNHIFFTKSKIVLLASTEKGTRAVELVPEKMLSQCQISGTDPLPGRISYLKGDPSRWRSDLPTYGSVVYQNAWPGIDLKFYATDNQLEYDLIVAPGADPSVARFTVDGGDRLEVGLQGELIVSGQGEPLLVQKRPIAYQELDGLRQEVASWLAVDGSSFSLAVAQYDRTRPLVIDPLVFSVFVGGTGNESIHDLAINSQGYIYIVGNTTSADYPVTLPAADEAYSAQNDCVITRITPDGSSIDRSTYLGGDQGDLCRAIAIRSDGEVIVAGYTKGGTFPIPTSGPTVPDKTHNGLYDMVVARLPYDLTSMRWATYLGGADDEYLLDLALDASNNIYVVGVTKSDDFPTVNAHQGSLNGDQDGVIVRLDDNYPTQVTVNFSTYLGGSEDVCAEDYGDRIQSVAVSDDAIYVGGYTCSTDFPTMGHNPKTIMGMYHDGFYGRLSLTGTPQFLSYLGGTSTEWETQVALSPDGDYFVLAGRTFSSNFFDYGFSDVPGYDKTYNNDDFFVVGLRTARVLTSSGWQYRASPLFATYLGGSDKEDYPQIAIGADGSIFVGGTTESTDFPVKKAVYGTINGAQDMFVTKLSADASTLEWSTYLGGTGSDFLYALAVDQSGAVIGGGRSNSAFPTANGGPGLDQYHGGSDDAVLFKLLPRDSSLVDAIRYLQVVAGLQPEGISVLTDDINGDGNIGLEEAINALKELGFQ
jgi:hypothetical protein